MLSLICNTENFKEGDATSQRKQLVSDLKCPTSDQFISFDEDVSKEKPSKIWKGRKVLRVHFMNPEVLDGWENGTSVANIMAWANSSWNSTFYEHIPRFEATKDMKIADIRVFFSSTCMFVYVAIPSVHVSLNIRQSV